jgi:predicted GTPase
MPLSTVPSLTLISGGISVTNTVPLTHIDHDEIKAVMGEYKISSADIAIRCDATIDDLIDILEAKSRSYIPVIYALNKIDAISIEELDLLYRIPNACPISSEHGWNVDELLEQMWEKLNLVRVYTKPKGKLPDYTAPVVLRSTRCTVEDFVSANYLNHVYLTTNLHSVTLFTRPSWMTSRLQSCMEDQSSISHNALVLRTSLLTKTLLPLSSDRYDHAETRHVAVTSQRRVMHSTHRQDQLRRDPVRKQYRRLNGLVRCSKLADQQASTMGVCSR